MKAHVSKVFTKLDCTNRVQIAIIALSGTDRHRRRLHLTAADRLLPHPVAVPFYVFID